MNPIIAAIQKHFDNGDQPKNFFSAYIMDHTRYGVEVQLTNNRRIVHDVFPSDGNEFFN